MIDYDEEYPYGFKVYTNYSEIIEWLDSFFKMYPHDVLVTVEEPEYIELSTMTSTQHVIIAKSGYISALFRHEKDALAFKITFGL